MVGAVTCAGKTPSTIINNNGTKKVDQSQLIKEVINVFANGGAAVSNLVTFANGNKEFLSIPQESLENFSGVLSKVATGVQGVILGIDAYTKRNLIPLLGYIAEIPISIFSSDFDFWVCRGLSQGLGQFQGILDRRRLKINDEEQKIQEITTIKEEDKIVEKVEERNIYMSDIMGMSTWGENFKITLKESWGIIKELFTNPKTIKNFSTGLFISSVSQITGMLMTVFGSKNIGPLVRDIAGAGVDVALITDKKKDALFKTAGYTWVLAAVADYAKRFSFIDNSIKNLTNLSLVSDRLASLLYAHENLNIQSSHKVKLADGEKEKLEKHREKYLNLSTAA